MKRVRFIGSGLDFCSPALCFVTFFEYLVILTRGLRNTRPSKRNGAFSYNRTAHCCKDHDLWHLRFAVEP